MRFGHESRLKPMHCLIALTLTAMGVLFATPAHADQPNVIPDGYSIQTIPIPERIRLEVGGMDFASDGRLFVCTRWGEVWVYDHDADHHPWQRFAEGLHEPLGILVDPDADQLTVYVLQKPELTRLVDTTGDGTADHFETICDDWALSDNYCDWAHGLARDDDGNFYITLNLSCQVDGYRVHGSTMGRPVPDRGLALRITPEGQREYFASGFRSPAGITRRPGTDEIWVTDNEGDWVPTSNLLHVEQGRFYGHPASLPDDPYHFPDATTLDEVNKLTAEDFLQARTPPVVWFPHDVTASSPGEPIFDDTGGAFGPFEGQIFVGDQRLANISRVDVEKVDGFYQGVVFDFINHTRSGIVRSKFGPDNAFWIGQTDRGWSSLGESTFGIERVVWDGQTIPFEMNTIRVQPDGFRISFTHEVDPDAAVELSNYSIEHWTYHYHPSYGSDRVDVTTVEPVDVTLGDDGRSVHLTLDEMITERVYAIQAPVPSTQGQQMSTDTGYYTLNRLPRD